MSSITALLQAAEFLDHAEKLQVLNARAEMAREAALLTLLPPPPPPLMEPSPPQSSSGEGSPRSPPTKKQRRVEGKKAASCLARVAHNELEKSRRAQLRGCLERMRILVPPNTSSKHTTLSLLKRAKDYIQSLETEREETERKLRKAQESQTLLRSHLELLTGRMTGQLQASGEQTLRPTSNSSASTISATEEQEKEEMKLEESRIQGPSEGRLHPFLFPLPTPTLPISLIPKPIYAESLI